MRSALVASILAIAGPASADEDPCAPDTPTDPAPAPTVTGRVRASGKIVDKKSGEGAAGATIVFTSPSVTGEEVLITDEHGLFAIELVPGTYTMTVYYLSATENVPNVRITENTWLGTTRVDDKGMQDHGCVFWSDHHSPDLASVPRFGFHAGRTEPIIVSRDRTHRAWLAPAAAADPATAVVTLNGGARLQSAPGIPVAFLEDSSVHTLRVPFETAGGSGGAAELALRSGSNTTHGDTRLVLGVDRAGSSGGIEALAGGPLKQDKAWIAGGVVANRTADATVAADAMVRANVAFSIEHQLAVTGMHQAHGDTTDSWANAEWMSKFLDAKLQITGGLGAEQLALPGAAALATTPLAGAIDRVGGTVGARLRYKGAGYHAFGLTVAAGGGQRGSDEHRDATIAAGDHWQIRPNLELHAGVRADARVFDGHRTSVTSPRVDLAYDPTQEGRSEVFVAYQRVSRLDDGLPGDWRTLPALFRDEVAVGAAWLHQSFKLPMVGIAARVRWDGSDERAGAARAQEIAGIDAWLRHERRDTTLHLGVTTVGGRVATVAAQRRLVDRTRNDLFAAATMRVSADRTEGGGALVWRHSGVTTEIDAKDDLSFDLALEGHGGTDGPGGRLLLGINW